MTRKFIEDQLVIATHNQGKLAEFRQMFGAVPLPRARRGGGMSSGANMAPSAQMHLRPRNMPTAPADTQRMNAPRTWGERIKFLSCADFKLPPPDETGKTFLENATLKALFVAQATERPALADDSGFCVAALDGAPGVYSADWAEVTPGGTRDFNMAMQRVHDTMKSSADKRAAFVCCLVLAWPDGHCESAQGRVEGSVAWPPRGKNGFGYDPMFRPENSAETYAEMESAAKNATSHRARAFRALVEACFL